MPSGVERTEEPDGHDGVVNLMRPHRPAPVRHGRASASGSIRCLKSGAGCSSTVAFQAWTMGHPRRGRFRRSPRGLRGHRSDDDRHARLEDAGFLNGDSAGSGQGARIETDRGDRRHQRLDHRRIKLPQQLADRDLHGSPAEELEGDCGADFKKVGWQQPPSRSRSITVRIRNDGGERLSPDGCLSMTNRSVRS